ncbi:MAG: DUF5320 domain-containing protein [Bacillota bacterium]
MVRGRDIYGPGFWKGGPGPAPWGWWGTWGGYCRLYPWLPRRWWAYLGVQLPGATPAPWWPWVAGTREADFLKRQAELLKGELEQVQNRLAQLESQTKKDNDKGE